MGPKIPFHCIISDNNDKEKNDIKCIYCNGVFYDPVLSIQDNQIYCKEYFYQKYKSLCDNNRNLEIDSLYKNIQKETFKNLNNFKFCCPLCLKNNININKDEYNYSSLIRHLTDCENKLLYQTLCPNYYCGNNISIYLKDIDKKELVHDILLNNSMLEKEIEYQKSTINDIEFQKYLKTKIKKENEINSLKNTVLNKKRKNENSENKNRKNNSEQKTPNSKNKNNEKRSNKKVEKNYDKDEQLSKKKEVVNNNKNNKLVSICPHLSGNYKKIFSCCNKGYGCVKCHLDNETHQITYNGEEQCLLCKIFFIGEKCPFCLVEKKLKLKY